jgi:hypothetical protein
MRKMTETPHQKFKNEHRALLNRWLDESDIEDMEMARIAMDDLNEWLGEDVLEFESEIELLDEDEETG